MTTNCTIRNNCDKKRNKLENVSGGKAENDNNPRNRRPGLKILISDMFGVSHILLVYQLSHILLVYINMSVVLTKTWVEHLYMSYMRCLFFIYVLSVLDVLNIVDVLAMQELMSFSIYF